MKRIFWILLLLIVFNPVQGQNFLRITTDNGNIFKSVQIITIIQDSIIIKKKLHTIIHQIPNQADSLEVKYNFVTLSINNISNIHVPSPNRSYLGTAIGGVIGLSLSLFDIRLSDENNTELLILTGSGAGLIFGMLSSYETFYNLKKMKKIEKINLIKSLIKSENEIIK